MSLGATFGYCLAHLDKHHAKMEFLREFGYAACNHGTLAYIIAHVPVFGTLLFVGGLGLTTLKLYENKTASSVSKLKQASKIAASTGAGIGAGVTGAILGQMLIPVPVLGAFIGGVIGGIIGYKTSTSVLEMLNRSHFVSMCHALEHSQMQDGRWEFTADAISHLGVSMEFFNESMPLELKARFPQHHFFDDVWMTLVVLGLLSVYYAQQDEQAKEGLQQQQ